MLHVRLSDEARVRIRTAPETEALGVAGLSGLVFGETRPSDNGVKVVGALIHDRAIAVHLDARDETLWFAPELVERVGLPGRARGAWAVNQRLSPDETPVTRFLGWLEQFLPRLGSGKDG
jgi:hypothetical protein